MKSIQNAYRVVPRFLMVLGFSVLIAGPAAAQDVTLTLPDTLLQSGEQKQLPVTTTAIQQDDSVLSGEFTLEYDDNVIDIPSVESSSTLLDNANITYNETTRKLAFAMDSHITGEGVLFYLQVKMHAGLSQGTGTALDISEAVFNETDSDINITTGRVATPDLRISPNSPTVTVDDTVYFSAEGNIFGDLTWSTSDPGIATINNQGRLIPDTTGNLQVYVEDSLGTSASTDLFRINPEHLTDLAISTPDTSIEQTRTLLWPVRATDLSGLNITSAQFELKFPSNHLKYQGFTVQNTLLETWSSPVVNTDQGLIKFAAAGSESLSGSGPLVYFEFKVHEEASGSHTPDLRNAMFNEDLTPSIQEGTITIENAPVIEVDPDTMKLVVGRQDTTHVTQGGLSPYTWQSSDTNTAEVTRLDQNSGIITGQHRGETNVYAYDDEGLQSKPVNVQVYDVPITLPDTTMQYPDSLMMPVNIGDLTSLNVYAYELRVDYDTSVVDFDELHSSGTISENMTISVNEDSLIKIATAGTEALSGEGTLLWLDFEFADSSESGDSTPVRIEDIQLNEPSGSTPTALPFDGQITLTGFAAAPDLQSPADGTQEVSRLPQLDWQYDDSGATFEVQLDTSSSLSTPLKNATGLSQTAYQVDDTLARNTTYYWRVRSHEGDAVSDWSPTWSFQTFNRVDSVTLLTPDDTASGIGLSPTFKWSTSDDAVHYQLQVSTVSDFSSLVADTGGIADTTHSFEGLLDGYTQYFWRVRGAREGVVSNWSAVYSFTTRPDVSLDYRAGWNLVGRPVKVENAHYQQLFPDANDGTLFGFADTYESRDSLKIGIGYWLQFGSAGTQTMTGTPVRSIQRNLNNGWNLIAGPVDSVSWGEIDDPDDILIDNTLYSFNGIYRSEDTLAPGHGYWVQANAGGTITLESTASKQKSIDRSPPEGFVKLNLSDASDRRRTLYFDGQLEDGRSLQSFNLPPIPPNNAFDIRLEDNRRLTEQAEAHLQLQGITPPLELRITDPRHPGRQFMARSGNNRKVGTSGESIQFNNGSIQELTVRPFKNSGSLPETIKLKQNFPNPFNPTTTIRYGLPKKAHVQLSIYNIKGNRVATPVNQPQKAGWHAIHFDATHLASGVYIYQLQAGPIQKTNKMILVK